VEWDTIKRVIKRRAMQVLFACGLLLTLAAAALWIASTLVPRVMAVQRWWIANGNDVHARLLVRADARQVAWAWLTTSTRRPGGGDAPAAKKGDYAQWFLFSHGGIWQRLGFWYEYERDADFLVQILVYFPWWFALALFAGFTSGPAAILWTARRRRLRARLGLCDVCAYDLRGAAHDRCPECGEPVAAPAPV
jgi:hypothetical protein